MSKPNLRSNFPRGSYLWSVRNAQWQAMGIPESDCEKPKIAVVNSSSELAACFSHLDQIAVQVKEAIREAGGVPFEIRTAAPSDFVTGVGARGAYMLGTRDLVTNDIEVAVEGAFLDGMVCLTSCDKTVPGQLMAAARLDVPTVMVPCGYQASGQYKGHPIDIEEVFIHSMHAVTGNMPVEEVVEMSREAIRSPGVCSGLGTANTMHIACEALGMALPGSAPVAALSDKMFTDARLAGRRIVEMVLNDLKPRTILSAGAFRNAVVAVLAIGGSLNAVKHLQAVATEGDTGVDVYQLFEQLGPTIPVLSAIRPIGERPIEEFEAAGGTRALMIQLREYLDLSPLTVSGQTVGSNLDEGTVADAEVIRPPGRPVAPRPAIVMLRGNLAPESALIKTGIVERRSRRFEGPAICFETSEAAIEAISNKTVRPGHVIVMRGAGAQGGPAMGGGASRVVFAIDGAGLGDQVAMLTDGHLSGLVCKGLVVAEVAPESALGGPLALVEDGDTVVIDLDQRRLDLSVSEDTLALRRSQWVAPPPKHDRGWLRIYQRNVGPLTAGAVLTGDKATD